MQIKTVWQLGSTDPENANYFATINQWWASLKGKDVTWRQRLIPQSGNVMELNWDLQRFDERFQIIDPQIRGTTLYWHKPDSPQERNTTVSKLEFDNLHQQLYIFPQSQKDVVIRVGIPEIVFQTLTMSHPQVTVANVGSDRILVLKDEQQQLEIKATLTAEALNQLKQQLP